MHREYIGMKTRVGKYVIETFVTGVSFCYETYRRNLDTNSMVLMAETNTRQFAWEAHKRWVKQSMSELPGEIAVATSRIHSTHYAPSLIPTPPGSTS